jgi:hypothetical protein
MDKTIMEMCKITLSYNENNALARRKLALLLSTGLFTQITEPMQESNDDAKQHRELRDAFFSGSRKSMSQVIANNV